MVRPQGEDDPILFSDDALEGYFNVLGYFMARQVLDGQLPEEGIFGILDRTQFVLDEMMGDPVSYPHTELHILFNTTLMLTVRRALEEPGNQLGN